MANQIPLSGLSDAAGGILLTPEQGALLTNGVLQEAGAIALAGDSRSISTRREQFPIWLGTPTASFVGEAGTKPVTGAEFGAGTLNVKKIASIVLFTDEQIEDLQSGDVNVLVDTGVRAAISDLADAHAVGKDSGTNITTSFDSMLRSTTSTVEWDSTKQDGFATAVSAAMGTLEANGYGNNNGILIPPDIARHIRDARATGGGTAAATAQAQGLYQPLNDPLYGLERHTSTNLNTITEAAGSNKIVGFVAHKANLHVRIRYDVRVNASSEATVHDGTGLRNMWQENLIGTRWETRLGFFIHDINRAVVAITNGS